MAKDFSGQRLRGWSLTGDLRGASFRGADLRGVSFRGADLTGADFSGARLGRGGWRNWASVLASVPAGLIAVLMAGAAIFFLGLLTFSVLSALKVTSFRTAGETGVSASDFSLGALVLIGFIVAAGLGLRWGRFWSTVSALVPGSMVALAVAEVVVLANDGALFAVEDAAIAATLAALVSGVSDVNYLGRSVTTILAGGRVGAIGPVSAVELRWWAPLAGLRTAGSPKGDWPCAAPPGARRPTPGRGLTIRPCGAAG